MKSKVLNKLFENANESIEIKNYLEEIKKSDKFYIFDEIMSDVKEEYFVLDSVHGISHNERVVLYTMLIGIRENLSSEELKLTLKSALYHDIGRKNTKGKMHGIESAKIIRENKEVFAKDYTEDEIKTLEFLCAIHSNPDEQFEEFATRYGLTNRESLRKMMNVLKDADALDRERLGRFGKLNTDFLRTESSKELVDFSKKTINTYREILATSETTLNTEIFATKQFNTIEDEENIYIFRALNETNIIDFDDNEKDIIRTKGHVSRDEGRKTKYTEKSNISLEEVYSSVRVAGSGKNNNCISFSADPNVSLDYMSDRYVMYAIPKSGDSQIINVGQYMLSQVSDRISQKIESKSLNAKTADLLLQIDSADSEDKIKSIIAKYIDGLNIQKGEPKKRYINRGEKLVNKSSIISRFDNRQYFSEEQNIEYIRQIAKLTLLEISGEYRSIIPYQSDNSYLLSGIGSAFSSLEFIHYGDIPKEKVIQLSKQNIELLSLVGQMQNQEGVDLNALSEIKTKILENIKSGKQDYQIEELEETKLELSVEDAFEYLQLSENSNEIIPYKKGINLLEFIKNYANAKVKTNRLLSSLKLEFKDNPEVLTLLEKMEHDTIIPNSSIINRVNNGGIKLTDTVNLSINLQKNNIYFSKEEEKSIIENLNKFSIKELEDLAQGRISDEVKNIISTSIKGNNYENGKKDYYIDFLLDSLDVEKIYKVSNVRTEKKTYLKDKIKEQLQEVDIIKLYNAFEKAGIDRAKVPNLILNLVLENGIGNVESFELLVETENLDEIIKENKNNLNENVTAYSLDRFLGIIDNSYKVPQSLIELRTYQAKVVDNIDDIYENHTFAGVVLPTGAGKSFVAMTQMLKNPKQNMIYFAPQDEILHQFQKHILKNILNKSVLNEKDIEFMQTLSDEEIREFLKDKVYNQDNNIIETIKKIKKCESVDKKAELNKKILPRRTKTKDDIMDAIKLVFPHLDMYCYQSLNGKEYEKLLEKNVDFMVFDELHRTGASTWKPLIRELINTAKSKNDKFKILGITATPIRDDDNVDMMRYMAEHYGDFSSEELEVKDYLAEEMYAVDAMQKRYLVEPKIVSFSFTLKYTDEYQYVKEKLAEELSKDPNSLVAKELQDIKDKMDEIIGTDSPTDIMNCLPLIKSIITQNTPIKMKNGKFIVFLPKNSNEKNQSSEEYVQGRMADVNKLFEDINSNIESGYLLSNRANKSENQKAINDFEISDDDTIRLLYAINMLNEGVHVENINGELMLRKIGEGSNILYFQQIGRVIFSIDPKNPVPDDEVPIIFDVYNNYLTRNLDRTANSTTPRSDLNNIQMVSNWMKIHERIPDINSTNHDEARKAIILKNLKEKYERYIDKIENPNLTASERKEIEKILEIAKEINLFEMEIPDRIIPPGEKELGRIHAFEVKGEIKSFLELYKKTTKVVKNNKTENKESLAEINLRLKNVMNVFLFLSQYNADLSLEGMMELSQKKYRNPVAKL